MLILRIAAVLSIVALVYALPHAAESYSQGAPAGFAGDVVDPFSGAQTCAVGGCHSSYGLNSGTGGVTITAPATATPGETVPITITVNNTTTAAPGSVRSQGFEATLRETTGANAYSGTLVIQDAINTRFPNGSTSYVTHTQTGTSQTSWTFGWTAPTASVPTSMTVFAAGNAANGGDLPAQPGDNSAGDYIYTATGTITIMPSAAEAGPPNAGLTLDHPSPNPATDVSRIVVGLATPATVTVRLVDGLGRTVRDVARREMNAGASELEIDVRGVAPGTYFVIAETPLGRQTQALRVTR